MTANEKTDAAPGHEFVRGLGLWDSTMIVAGSMIGSGIFIVSADIARQVGSTGWLLVVWLITGALTIIAALNYGELAAMMPHAGGQYVYLREAYSPLVGISLWMDAFSRHPDGHHCGGRRGFARFLGILLPAVLADWSGSSRPSTSPTNTPSASPRSNGRHPRHRLC